MAGPFLSSSVRMGRKEGMSVIGLSQVIEDFVRSPYGAAIVGNSSTKLVGQPGGESVEGLRVNLRLTERQVEQVRRLSRTPRYHEFLLIQGDRCNVVRVPADPFSKWVFTTNLEGPGAFRAARRRAARPVAPRPGAAPCCGRLSVGSAPSVGGRRGDGRRGVARPRTDPRRREPAGDPGPDRRPPRAGGRLGGASERTAGRPSRASPAFFRCFLARWAAGPLAAGSGRGCVAAGWWLRVRFSDAALVSRSFGGAVAAGRLLSRRARPRLRRCLGVLTVGHRPAFAAARRGLRRIVVLRPESDGPLAPAQAELRGRRKRRVRSCVAVADGRPLCGDEQWR